VIAQTYNSGFPLAHDTYNGMGVGSDGLIYYVLCSDRHDTAGQMYVFDPLTGQIRHLGDLSAICGDPGRQAVSQGKSHVNFVEATGTLYFATHTGYYSTVGDMEKMGIPPPGWEPYPGGHLLAYHLTTGRFEDLGVAPLREGVLSMNMDTARGRIYGLTWPSGHFFHLDLATRQIKDLGPFFHGGENGAGSEYRTICRSLVVDPRDGSVYFTTGEGTILRHRYNHDSTESVEGR
jgi:hypothetical protein